MFIAKKYKHRHLILKTLQEFFENHDSPNALPHEAELSFEKLVGKSGLSESEVIKQIDYLNKEGEIYINWRNYNASYQIVRNGTISYNDEKYLIIGKNESLKHRNDYIKNVSTTIAVILAIATFAFNFFKTQENAENIDSINIEIKKMKDSIEDDKKVKDKVSLPSTHLRRNL